MTTSERATGASERISATEARALLSKPVKGRKYRNKPVTVDGIRFDSTAEAAYYAGLKMRERADEIADVELQPRFPLLVNGHLIGVYKADFSYFDMAENRRRVIDVKGVETREFKRTRKHVRAQYGLEIEVVK